MTVNSRTRPTIACSISLGRVSSEAESLNHRCKPCNKLCNKLCNKWREKLIFQLYSRQVVKTLSKSNTPAFAGGARDSNVCAPTNPDPLTGNFRLPKMRTRPEVPLGNAPFLMRSACWSKTTMWS